MAASPATSRRPMHTRQTASRRRSQYIDPDTEDEFLTRTEDDSIADDSPRAPKRPRITASRQQPETRSRGVVKSRSKATKSKRKNAKSKVVVIGRPKRARGDTSKRDLELGRFTGPSDGVIPRWRTLPPDILADIFYFGSHGSDARWLLRAATICRDFMEPALEALYYRPSMRIPAQLYHLLEALRRRGGRIMNYNTKVKRLVIDVRRLAYTAHNSVRRLASTTHDRPLFNLGDLLAEMPRLQHLEIIHPVDEPPYRDMRLQPWDYHSELFTGLSTSQIRLTTWRWTRNMLKNRCLFDVYPDMLKIHDTPAFQGIRELILCGFDNKIDQDDDEESQRPDIWSAISKLKHVKDITFISCSIVREKELTKLPATLERLELSNCHEVNSDVLALYLIDGGSHLKELVLNHNPALDLAFLPGLKLQCPQLEGLRMSLNLYSELHATNDAEPLYDELLQDDEVPEWPRTMRSIDIQHMQKWKAAGAENLFRSLIDEAAELPDLRHIVLHSHIDIPWRDRTGFRERWIDRLEKVFRRPDVPPEPHTGSKRQYLLWKQQSGSSKVIDTGSVTSEPLSAELNADDGKAYSKRRSRRVATVLGSPTATVSVVGADSSYDDAPTAASEESDVVQGLCDVVDIRVDNQRPRENQYTERDFLDSEASGDEDWNENADEAEDGYAW